MPWLFLDTHAPGQVRLGWLSEQGPQVAARPVKAHAALTWLAEIWPADPATIRGVCVVAGPGSFSSVRSGVLDANLIARWLNVPLIGVTVAEATDEQLPELARHLRSGSGPSPVPYVAPIYDREPNISTPKSL